MWQFFTITVLFGLMAGISYLPGGAGAQLIAPIGFVLLAAFTMGEFFKRINLPALLGYIVAGLLFGPELASLFVEESHPLHLLPTEITEKELKYVQILTVGVIGTLGGGELVLDDLKDQIGTILRIIGLAFVAIVPLTAAVVYALPSILGAVPDAVYNVLGAGPGAVLIAPDQPTSIRLSIAMLFGVFGFAMSPAATLAIIQEAKAKGRFTSMVLGVVIVADLVLVASYLMTESIAVILVEQFADKPIAFGKLGGALLHELPVIGAEFMWALIIGAVAGAAFILYFRFVAREMIFFTVGVIFVTYYACTQLHAEKLLAFITAGFIVQNLSKHGHDMIEALEQISLPVFVVYFTLEAMSIDLKALWGAIPLAVILTLLRTGALWAALRWALPKLQSLPDSDRDNLWFSFFSRGGVDLVLAVLLTEEASRLGEWTYDFKSVIMAVVVIHIIAGPPLLKLAFDRVGDSDGANDDEPEIDENAASDDESSSPRTPLESLVDDPLPHPDVEDEDLQRHLDHLHEALDGLHQTHVVDPLRTYDEEIETALNQIDRRIRESLDELESILDEADDRPLDAVASEVRRCHKRARQGMQPTLEQLDRLPALAFDPDRAESFFSSLRELEGFETLFQVDWGEDMLEPRSDDGWGTRLVKLGRRLYARLFELGHRSVPTGRLWRYFVELTLPIAFEHRVQETHPELERFWFRLLRQLRSFDRFFQQIVDRLHAAQGEEVDDDWSLMLEATRGEREETSRRPALPITSEPDEVPYLEASPPELPTRLSDGGSEAETDDLPVRPLPEEPEHPVEAARDALDAFRDEVETRTHAMHSDLADASQQLLESLTRAMHFTFENFLDGVDHAGSIHLPRFRYRPSTRFDRARQAERQIQSRLATSERFVRGWIELDHELTLFLSWFHGYLDRISRTFDRRIREECLETLHELETPCRQRPDDFEYDEEGKPTDRPIDWTAWLETHVEPELDRTREILNDTLDDLTQGNVTQQLLEVLETRIVRFDDSMLLLAELPEAVPPDPGEIDVVDVPVRNWYLAELIRETALRFVEFNEHAERSLRRSLVALEDIEQILEFNLQTAQDEVDDEVDAEDNLEMNRLADGGLRRVVERIETLHTSMERDERELRRWIQIELRRIVCVASAPFLNDEVAELPERLEQHRIPRLSDEAGPVERILSPVRRRVDALVDRVMPPIRQFADDLRNELSDEENVPSKEEIRSRLRVDTAVARADIPVIYRRIFTPIPVDIPDFYIERRELEQSCMDAVMEWLEGDTSSILLHSDRGMGKSTFIHHLLPVQLFDTYDDLERDRVTTLHLGERPASEAELCRELAPLIPGDPPDSLSALAHRIHNDSEEHVVFLEDGERLYTRTPEGLELCRAFLDFMERTSDRILWVVLLETPAATFLDTALGLFDFFTHVFEMPPFDADEIEEMISIRHRVSGFHLEFEPPETRPIDHVRHPIAASEASRHPRRAFFERLGRLSGGNPMLALLYWLQSVRPDPEDDTRFRVDPLPKEETSVLEPLSLDQRVLLATLLQHGTLRLDRLARIVDMSKSDVRTKMNHLMRMGFVESTQGQFAYYELRSFAAPLVTRELREHNMV